MDISKIKELILQVLDDMYKEIGIEEVDNTTSNVAGYDIPFGKTQKRKLSVVSDIEDED